MPRLTRWGVLRYAMFGHPNEGKVTAERFVTGLLGRREHEKARHYGRAFGSCLVVEGSEMVRDADRRGVDVVVPLGVGI